MLLHSLYKTFTEAWFAQFWPFMGAAINQTRQSFGLAEAGSWPELFSAHTRLLSVVPSAFDAPTVELPESMRHFGFLVPDGRYDSDEPDWPAREGPAVLVALNTTNLHQEGLFQAIPGGLGGLPVRGLASMAGVADPTRLRVPPNVAVAGYLNHRAVLTEADAVVTHAGLGTIAAALSQGVPMVCAPIARDQHVNAERVACVGAGIVIGPDVNAAEVAQGVERVLSGPAYRQAAVEVADQSLKAGGAAAAVLEFESLLSGT